jgi:hypothetical protein
LKEKGTVPCGGEASRRRISFQKSGLAKEVRDGRWAHRKEEEDDCHWTREHVAMTGEREEAPREDKDARTETVSCPITLSSWIQQCLTLTRCH